MPLPFETSYPPELTNDAWQKHKSLTDKLFSSTKTGIGDELKKLKAAWDKVNFTELDPDALFHKGKSSPDDLEKARVEAAKIVAGPMKQIIGQLKTLSTSASKAATNKSLSKEAKDAVGTIAVISSKLANKMGSYDVDVFSKIAERQLKQQDETIKKFTVSYAQLDKLFRALAASPNAKSFGTVVKLVAKVLGEMQPATGSMSRMEGPKQKQWAAASKAIKDIESQIPPVVVAIKGKDEKAIETAIFGLVKTGSDQQAVFKAAAA